MLADVNPEKDLENIVGINFKFTIFAFLELTIASFITLTISPDPKSAWFLGFSQQRWALMIFELILAISFLIAGTIIFRRNSTLIYFIRNRTNDAAQYVLKSGGALLVLWGWCSIFFPAYLFGGAAAYFERLRPLSIAIGLILFQLYILTSFLDGKFKHLDFGKIFTRDVYRRPTAISGLVLIGIAIFIGVSKIGLVQNIPYWNVPGIPLTGLQLFFIIVLLLAGYYFSKILPSKLSTSLSKLYWLLPLVIYMGAVLAWGLTPMMKHFNSLQPTPPNFQPFPSADARIYDYGSISILEGVSKYFKIATDKPLYMIFLAFLHVFAGYDYSLMSWLQIMVLAFIPVILYFLGAKFYNKFLGVFLAFITIIRQRNAIVLSYKIASVNPKPLVTEELTLLGLVLIAFLMFLWLRTQKPWLALLTGAAVGAASLIRLNPIFIFPAAVLLAFAALWKFPAIKWKQILVFILGFSMIIVPWLLTGTHPKTGTPWLFVKGMVVADTRYNKEVVPKDTEIPSGMLPNTPNPALTISTPKPTQPAVKPTKPGVKPTLSTATKSPVVKKTPTPTPLPQSLPEKKNPFLPLFINHVLHNFSTSVLSLPDSLIYDDLSHLTEREYWQDGNRWSGRFPAVQIIFILINFLLVAVGLGYSWQKFRWAGLVPLVIFISYSISLGFAANSGGRYIVPMDWVIYFYYGLAIVIIIGEGARLIKGDAASEPGHIINGKIASSSVQKYFWYSIAITAFLASLIPLADLGLPIFSSPLRDFKKVERYIQTISANQKDGEDIIYGEVIYPYYDREGRLNFDLLNSGKISSYSVNNDQLVTKDVVLFGGELAFVVTKPENNEITIRSIYVEEESNPRLIWEYTYKRK